MDEPELLKHRYQKFRKIGRVQEGIPLSPIKKANLKKSSRPISLPGKTPDESKQKILRAKQLSAKKLKPGKTPDVELKDQVQKSKQNILRAKQQSAKKLKRSSNQSIQKLGNNKLQQKVGITKQLYAKKKNINLIINQMIQKLRREVDGELSKAVKAVGLVEKINMVQEEIAKASNSNEQLLDTGVQEKIDNVIKDFQQNLSAAPNYAILKQKVEMLKRVSKFKAQKRSEESSKGGELKQEINKRIQEVFSQPEMKQKTEELKTEIENLGMSEETREKMLQLKVETGLELFSSLTSLSLSSNPSPFVGAKEKVDEFNQEIKEVMKDVIHATDLKKKIELLKIEVARSGKIPIAESKTKIKALQQEIKQKLVDAMSSLEYKEKHEKLLEEISGENKSSGGSNGSLKHDDDKFKSDEEKLEVSLVVI